MPSRKIIRANSATVGSAIDDFGLAPTLVVAVQAESYPWEVGNMYAIKYRLTEAPAARDDGSAMVDHNIVAISQVEGGDDWVEVPHREKVISLDAYKIAILMDMPHDTGPQKAAKVAKYKQLLYDGRANVPIPKEGWSTDVLASILDANDVANAAAASVDAFLTVVLNQTYPVDFSIDDF